MRLVALSAVFVAAVALPGCAAMADATAKMGDVGQISMEKSTFDGATIITASPNFLFNKEKSVMLMPNSIKLGGRWSGRNPESVDLIMLYDLASVPVGIRGLDINIDGEISSYEAKTLTSMSPGSSENYVTVPLDILRKMVSSSNCRLRIVTTRGSEESTFSMDRIPGGSSSARMSLRSLLAQIDAIRQANLKP